MEISNAQELFVFFGSAVGGMAIGVLYDVFRIWRKSFPVPTALVWVQDVLFWLLLTVLVYATIFITNSARVRWYEFAAMGLGCLLYALTLSRWVIALCTCVLRAVRRGVLFCLKIILYPLYLANRLLSRPVTRLKGWARAVARRIFRWGREEIKQITRIFRKI